MAGISHFPHIPMTYEQGVALIRACQQQLEQAEQRIQRLARDANGEETLVPFAAPGDSQP